jgi:CheY-like chemotaxis protein
MTTTAPNPILVVEDDPPTQKLLQAVLRRFGYESEIASDGSEAISRLRANDYALVVLDMMMPTTDGRAVINFLAAQDKAVPVIICSAAGPAALQELPPRIVKGVVRKPFDIDQFILMIASVTGPDA